MFLLLHLFFSLFLVRSQQGYFEGLREELLSKNIKVTLVCPGAVKSQVLQNAIAGDVNKVSFSEFFFFFFFWGGGGVAWFFQTLTLFQNEICNFPVPFLPIFRPCF